MNKHLQERKKSGAESRQPSVFLSFGPYLLLFAFSLFYTAGATGAEVKLQAPGSELCYICHSDLQSEFAKGVVHPPVEKGDCVGCHNPHATRPLHLLKLPPGELCWECHQKMQAQLQKTSVHQPVKKEECLSCHEPHSSPQEKLLKKKGNALCLECHPERLADLKKPFVHSAMAKGSCLDCHLPHSSDNESLLVKASPALCQKCHQIDNPALRAKHLNIALQGVNCSGCHDPHGSENPNLVRSNMHMPFAKKECGKCHLVGSDNPRNLKAENEQLCYSCHSTKEVKFKAGLVHPPVEEGQCLTCHNPHASDSPSLLVDMERKVCFQCHVEVQETVLTSLSSHPLKVVDGRQCTTCHNPHSSEQKFLFKLPALELCASCHERHARFTHPIGEGVTDPRSGLMLTCVTCHEPHGTQFRFTLRGNPDRELCVQCHKQGI